MYFAVNSYLPPSFLIVLALLSTSTLRAEESADFYGGSAKPKLCVSTNSHTKFVSNPDHFLDDINRLVERLDKETLEKIGSTETALRQLDEFAAAMESSTQEAKLQQSTAADHGYWLEAGFLSYIGCSIIVESNGRALFRGAGRYELGFSSAKNLSDDSLGKLSLARARGKLENQMVDADEPDLSTLNLHNILPPQFTIYAHKRYTTCVDVIAGLND